jgi:L-2-hydroxyglutarate oxidase
LLDAFCLVDGDHLIHIFNAPSPAATASISIGRTIADHAEELLDLNERKASADA